MSNQKDMMMSMEKTWRHELGFYFSTTEYRELANFVSSQYEKEEVFPKIEEIFNAFTYTPYHEVSVVILGQDPYHDEGQAHGLAFSVKESVAVPPSLKNIYKEIESEFGFCCVERNGNLESWARQGVLLLNAILTVAAHKPASHRSKGWEHFTDIVLQTISQKREHVVFLLWGNYACSKKSLIDTSKHLVLEASHPSPLSAYKGFFGCGHFKTCNNYLISHNKKPIVW